MKRLATIALAVAALIAVCAPAASAGIDNEYQGRVERTDGTYFGFDLAHKHGTTRVKRVIALLNYSCAGGSGGRAPALARGSLKVEKGAFAGKLQLDTSSRAARGGISRGSYTVTGELRKHGKASGTIDAVVFTTNVRARRGSIRCYTGRLDWKATKGATVPINRAAGLRR
jgi:hypothetical protein